MASALSSLTDTYTDSEGEDIYHEELRKPAKVEVEKPPPVAPRVGGRMHLVSYGDDHDAALSDEDHEKNEEEDNSSVVILLPQRPATPAIPEPMEESPENGTAEEPEPPAEPQEELPVFTDVDIPPEPPGVCSFDLLQKIVDLTEKMRNKNVDMNTIIQQRKAFRNPSIYEKLIQFCNINEFGTNYEPHIYDPLKWGKDSYYDELAKSQKKALEVKDRERREKSSANKRLQVPVVEFVVGTKRTSNGSGAAGEDEIKKRVSKWDQVGVFPAAGSKPTPASLAKLTSSITGTKGTVISAFGSLPKKPKI